MNAVERVRIDRALPYVKREGLAALRRDYPSHEAARTGIAEALGSFYRRDYPDVAANQARAIEEAASELADLYSYNVFPEMKVTWGTYPDHIGHEASPGCYRCHDKKHRAGRRDRISNDCETCHTILAERETEPEILDQLLP